MIVDVVLRSPTEPVVTKTEPIPEAKKSYVAGETEKMQETEKTEKSKVETEIEVEKKREGDKEEIYIS